MFGRKCSVIGVVHLPPLPGSAGFKGGIDGILATALSDALTYKENGVDALLVENMHDVPYLKGFVYPETTATMTVVARALKYECQLPLGLQLLAGANMEALGAAVAADIDFIRVEGYVYAHIGDEGLHESCAAALIRKRANLHAERIKIFADVKKKHSSHAITSDISLEDTARDAEFFKADGVIVSGMSTGHAPEPSELRAVRSSVACHVLVGSGVTADNVHQFTPNADALIVGSSLKFDGHWRNEVDPARVERLMKTIEKKW